VAKSYMEAVRYLAQDAERCGYEAYFLLDPACRVVRRVTVGDDGPLPDSADIVAFHFGPWPEVPFESSEVALSSAEWDMVKKGEKQMPEGWDVGKLTRVGPKGMLVLEKPVPVEDSAFQHDTVDACLSSVK